jgi:hypothetical protein
MIVILLISPALSFSVHPGALVAAAATVKLPPVAVVSPPRLAAPHSFVLDAIVPSHDP